MNWKYIMGTATILMIVGGTIYAIKKSKDLDKIDEDVVITAEQARLEVEAMRRQAKMEEHAQEFEELVDDIRDTANFNRSFMPYDDREVEEFEEMIDDIYIETNAILDEMEEELEDDEYLLEDTDIEEDGELRYEPSSIDARNQFIRMELAEWAPLEDTYQTMLRLFDIPFEPKNDGDWDLKTVIIDFRVQFFGFGSRWAKEVTIADVILHYARAATFNCDESVKYWTEYFLDFNELDLTVPSHIIDENIDLLNNHAYFNEERQTFGLFGLTREGMDQAIKIASRNIDSSVTYEIEFNEFLKSCL